MSHIKQLIEERNHEYLKLLDRLFWATEGMTEDEFMEREAAREEREMLLQADRFINSFSD